MTWPREVTSVGKEATPDKPPVVPTGPTNETDGELLETDKLASPLQAPLVRPIPVDPPILNVIEGASDSGPSNNPSDDTVSTPQPNVVSEDPDRENADLKTFLNRLMDLLILPSGNMPPQERTLVDDLVSHAIYFAPKEHQVKIVDRLIAHHATPRALIRSLIHADDDLAIPLLGSHLALSDSDLISVIHEKGSEHWRTIAARDSLTSSVADALVRCADSATLRILLRNDWVRLSRMSFVMLAKRSIEDESIREPLIERVDLPTDLAHLVFWWSDHNLRRRIIERFTCQRQSILEPIPSKIFKSLFEKKGDVARAVRMLARSNHTDREMIAKAIEALERNDGNLCLDLLSQAAEITPETAAQILDDVGGEPIAVMAKACSFGRENFFRLRRILAKRQGKVWKEATDLTDAVTIVYETLSTDRADVILRYWDRVSREVYDSPNEDIQAEQTSNENSQAPVS